MNGTSAIDLSAPIKTKYLKSNGELYVEPGGGMNYSMIHIGAQISTKILTSSEAVAEAFLAAQNIAAVRVTLSVSSC
jgi:hypothetical protein